MERIDVPVVARAEVICQVRQIAGVGRRCHQIRRVRSDLRVVPESSVGKCDGGHSIPRGGKFTGEGQRVAGRLVLYDQVGKGRAGAVQRDVRRVEAVEDQRAYVVVIAVAIDGKRLARIAGSPDDLDRRIVAGADVAERPGAEVIDDRIIEQEKGVIRSRRRRSRPDVAVRRDGGGLPDGAVGEGDRGHALPPIGALAGKRELGAARIIFDGQIGKIRTGPVERDVAGIEISQYQRADVPVTAVDQEGLARIRRPPHDFDRLVVLGSDVAERPGAEVVDDRAGEVTGVIHAGRRRGGRDIGVGGDGGGLPRGAVAEGYRSDAVPRIAEFVVESERRAARIIFDCQVG